MKIWLSKNSEVSLREQLTRQIMAAISSGNLRSGDKLPSVRELSLRFKIHQNTVSSAYKWLEENGWTESRQGSGVFVCEIAKEKKATAVFETELHSLISQFFERAQRLGFTNSEIETGIKSFLSSPKYERLLVAEEDEYLRQIIHTELKPAINLPICSVAPQILSNPNYPTNSLIVCFPETAEKVSVFLPDKSVFTLKMNSAQDEIKGQQKPQTEDLIGVVSGWDLFLRWAKTFLLAVGIEAENIVLRDAKEKNFQRGLDSCIFVITDSATAEILPEKLEKKVFRLISHDSIEELKSLIT